MSKVLNVIEPFMFLETGDKFELNENADSYVYEHNESFKNKDNKIKSSVTSVFSISPEYAKELIKNGILEDPFATKTNSSFVNVFDEIDDMLIKYNADLRNIDKDMKGQPECLKVEKTTVLSNLIKVLTHLKGLRK